MGNIRLFFLTVDSHFLILIIWFVEKTYLRILIGDVMNSTNSLAHQIRLIIFSDCWKSRNKLKSLLTKKIYFFVYVIFLRYTIIIIFLPRFDISFLWSIKPWFRLPFEWLEHHEIPWNPLLNLIKVFINNEPWIIKKIIKC